MKSPIILISWRPECLVDGGLNSSCCGHLAGVGRAGVESETLTRPAPRPSAGRRANNRAHLSSLRGPPVLKPAPAPYPSGAGRPRPHLDRWWRLDGRAAPTAPHQGRGSAHSPQARLIDASRKRRQPSELPRFSRPLRATLRSKTQDWTAA